MSEYRRLTVKDSCYYDEMDNVDVDALYCRLAELEDKIESGRLVELPCTAMIEQGIVDGKFKPTKEAQQFNGRHAVVYIDKSKFKKPLIDICWNNCSKYDHYAAEARLKELRGEK